MVRPLRHLWLCWFPLVSVAHFGCAPVFEPDRGTAPVEVRAEDGSELDMLSPAPRLRLSGIPAERLPEVFLGLRLFEGALSSYAEGRLEDGEVIQSLREREVPLAVWMDGGDLVALPTRFLDPATSYTLAAAGEGTLAELGTSDAPFRRLHLLWPRQIIGGGTLVYCSEAHAEAPAFETEQLSLGPSDDKAEVHSGVGAEGVEAARCSSVEVQGVPGSGFIVPSRSVIDVEESTMPWVLEPLPIAVVPAPEGPPVEAAACDTPLGPACARFSGDTLLLEHAPPGAWALRGVSSKGDIVESLVVAIDGESPKMHGFEANTAYELSATYVDGFGRVVSAGIELESGEKMPRVVINEVLANARGAEPDSEWIELFNAGSASARLAGWSLQDGGGVTVLPDVVLEPGAYGLIVGKAYVATGDDEVPRASAVPIVVERVGKSGLSNTGEALRLSSAEGEVVSAVPALPSTTAGVSIARIDPLSADVAESFGKHASPGASPGAPNVVEDQFAGGDR